MATFITIRNVYINLDQVRSVQSVSDTEERVYFAGTKEPMTFHDQEAYCLRGWLNAHSENAIVLSVLGEIDQSGYKAARVACEMAEAAQVECYRMHASNDQLKDENAALRDKIKAQDARITELQVIAAKMLGFEYGDKVHFVGRPQDSRPGTVMGFDITPGDPRIIVTDAEDWGKDVLCTPESLIKVEVR